MSIYKGAIAAIDHSFANGCYTPCTESLRQLAPVDSFEQLEFCIVVVDHRTSQMRVPLTVLLATSQGRS